MNRSRTVQPARSTGKRMLLMLILVAAVFGAIFGFKWYGNKMMNEFMDAMPMPPAAVTAAVARTETWTDSLDAVGTLVAVNGTDVTTEAAGVVSAIRFESGQSVSKGDVLLQLDASTELASLRALDASLRLATTQRDRFRELYEGRRLVARADLDQRESEVEQLQAQAQEQRAIVARKTIRAPFSGQLGIRKVNLGQYLNPGDPIVSLQALDPIHLNFSLPEQRLGQVQVGQEVTITVDSQAGTAYTGTISAIEPQVEANTRSFTVQATLANPEASLRPGTFARVSAAIGDATEVVVIPQTAISFNPYGNSVYVIADAQAAGGGAGAPAPADGAAPDAEADGSQAGPPVEVRAEGEADARAQADAGGDADATQAAADSDGAAPGQAPTLTVTQRFVQTGATRGDLIAVTEGLQPGERVATSGLLKLRNGAAVVINDTVEPSADAEPTPENR
jgi:membrane fusion protein (multidrug efflux system)